MRFAKTIALLLVLAVSVGCATAQTGIPPRGVTIATLVEDETVYVGALEHSPRILRPARWIRIWADEAITVKFNGGPIRYLGADEDIVSQVGDADHSVGETVPISANEWHIFTCSATLLELTDCNGGTASIIAEY